jgi:MFS family permease
MAVQDIALAADAPAAPAYPSTFTGWRAVAILFVLYGLSTVDRNVLTLLVGPIRQSLGLGDFQISLLLGFAFAICFSLAGFPVGWALDRFPRRHVIFVCVVAWSLATAGCGLATTFALMFAARMAVGMGESGVLPGAQSILGDSFPPSRLTFPLAVFTLGAKAGEALSFMVGGALTALIPPSAAYVMFSSGAALQGWQLIFIVVGLPGIVLALLIYTLPEPPRRRVRAANSAGYGEYVTWFRRVPGVVLASHIGCVFYYGAAITVTSWGATYIQRQFGWSAAGTGAGMGAALLIGAVLGIPLHGLISHRLFARGVLDVHFWHQAVTALLALPIGVSIVLAKDPGTAVALMGVFAFVSSGYISMPITIVQIISPSHLRGKSAAVLLMVSGLCGGTLGPSIVAFFADYVFRDPQKIGLSIAASLALLLPIAAGVCLMGLRPMRRAVLASRSA